MSQNHEMSIPEFAMIYKTDNHKGHGRASNIKSDLLHDLAH